MNDIQRLKEDICKIGDRLYRRGFAAANDGNITCRIGENEVLCTPTLQCKGFMEPDDICTIDMQGNKIAGNKERSSEALLHLEIFRQRPDVRSIVHCHPPHATAFAVAREAIPQCVLPEVEFLLGNVPIAAYETPGTQEFANTILPFVHQTDVIILANHGTVSYAEDVERAFWKTEVLDSYCRILILAKQLGHVEYMPRQKAKDLLDKKQHVGIDDARLRDEFKDCDVCGNEVFRETWKDAGVASRAFRHAPQGGVPTKLLGQGLFANSEERQAAVRAIVDEVTQRVVSTLENG